MPVDIGFFRRTIFTIAATTTFVASGAHAQTSNPTDKNQAPVSQNRIQIAADKPSDEGLSGILSRPQLTGDWGGARTDLTDNGIEIGLRLSQYYQGVSSGGTNENSEYGGTMDYRVNADLKKALGTWDGLTVVMHARTRFGRDITADAGAMVLPNTGMVSQLPGEYHGTDITGLIASQTFPLGDKVGDLLIGKFDVVDTVTGFFPNLAYGQEGFWNLHSSITALPWFGAVTGLSLYGAIGQTIRPEYGLGESGIIALGTENVSDTWRSIHDSFKDGVWLAAFHRFFWEADDKMGYFMLFGGYSTREQASNDPHDIVVIPGQGLQDDTRKNPWNIAAYLYQDIWQAAGNPKRKANIMIGGTVGPDNPQFAQYNIFANAEVFGLMESRPNDRMGVGAFYNTLSDNFKKLVRPVVNLRDMWGVEIYYNAEIIPSVRLSPDLQLVRNEVSEDDFAVIPGVRLTVDF